MCGFAAVLDELSLSSRDIVCFSLWGEALLNIILEHDYQLADESGILNIGLCAWDNINFR